MHYYRFITLAIATAFVLTLSSTVDAATTGNKVSGRYYEERGEHGEHGRYGDDHGRYGDDHGRYGDDHGRYGDDHGRYGDDHGRYGDDRGRYGDDHGRYGNGRDKYDDDRGKYSGGHNHRDGDYRIPMEFERRSERQGNAAVERQSFSATGNYVHNVARGDNQAGDRPAPNAGQKPDEVEEESREEESRGAEA